MPVLVGALVLLLLLAGAAPAAGGPGMGWGQWTSPDLTFAECMARTPKALQAERMTTVERYGRVWFGSSAGEVSATVICYGRPNGALVTIFAANDGDSGPSGALTGRLADRIFTVEKPIGVQSRVARVTGPAKPKPKVPPTTTPKPPASDGWPSGAAAGLRGQNGKRFVFDCAANGPAGARLYGTDVYTDDSSPCTAGVHVGLITYAKGGRVTIEIRPGQDSYPGSSRNGVGSSTWGTWPGSFVVVGP